MTGESTTQGMPVLRVLSRREASIFACVCDTVVAPEPALPAVRETEAVAAFDRLLVVSPPLNRFALRLLLYVAELAPRAVFGARLRRLSAEQRGRALVRLETARAPQLRQLVALVKTVACLSYYGDDRVAARLGYDADAVVQRARSLRLEEARP